jgi:aminoglycoside phosphotransferase family enzyme/predicted kinase
VSKDSHIDLIAALRQAAAYDHAVRDITLVETHISWVLLTGDFVYKLKKPVNFGFLDFSTLALRKHYCDEEVRLNRRYAPQLYLGVVSITDSLRGPHINGSGPVLEYAVKMVQFDDSKLFSRLLADGLLGRDHMDETAEVLAGFHARCERAEATSPYGDPEAVQQPVMENFAQLQQHAGDYLAQQPLATLFDAVHTWSEQTFARLRPLLAQRKLDGFVRECHGDLHLRNIVLIDTQVVPFDGIEFNANLRWIDVMSELAFLLMDLEDHQRRDLARRLLNAYLQLSGDYDGLHVLRFYQCYRAMVRAKVAALRRSQDAEARTECEQDIHNYLQLAHDYTRQCQPYLVITHGLSGSGKTTLTQALLEATELIRVRSDVERKRLFKLSAQARTGAGVDTGIYTADASTHTYARLAELARSVLQAGLPVVVDATFIKQAQREPFRRLAQELRLPFFILHCDIEPEEQRRRIMAREQAAKDASEAGLLVLQHQLQSQEPLTASEQPFVVRVDTTREIDIAPVLEKITAAQE